MPKTPCMADRRRVAIIQDARLPCYRTPSLKDVGEKVKPPDKLSRRLVEEDETKVLVEPSTPAADRLVVLQEPARRIEVITGGLAFNYGLEYCHKCRSGRVCFIAEFYECYIAKYEMYSGSLYFRDTSPLSPTGSSENICTTTTTVAMTTSEVV